MDADVVIVGAGPTGLLLARELRLAGLAPIVLERLTEPTGLSKALGLIGRSVDFLDYRGVLDRFRARGTVAPPGALHFALIPLDAGKLEKLGLRGIFIQQAARGAPPASPWSTTPAPRKHRTSIRSCCPPPAPRSPTR
jgi:2-polyprenyl-6-methoxyphenol hydroxylase-like FAD-dependent oxidoreductase